MKVIEIKNIKKITDGKFEFPDNTKLLLMKGKNKVGKSTIAQVIGSILTAKGFEKATTKGKNSSEVVYKGQDIDGNDIVITWIIEEGRSKFKLRYLTGNKIKTISNVNDIRRIAGSYFKYTPQDIFTMLSSVPGKRKFMREFVLFSLPVELQNEYESLTNTISSNENKDTKNNLYFQRRDLNKKLEQITASLSVVPDKSKLQKELEEEQKKVETLSSQLKIKNQYQEILEVLRNDYREIIEKYKIVKSVMIQLHDSLKSLYGLLNTDPPDVSLTTTKMAVETKLGELQAKANTLKADIDKIDVDDEKLMEAKVNADVIRKEIYDLKRYESMIEEREKLIEDIQLLNSSIDNIKKRINDILSKAKMPAGIKIEDDNIYLNGFILDENIVSDTETRLSLIELLGNMNTSGFVDIGDVSLYDSESYAELLKIADKTNSILVGQKVTESNLEMEIITD